MIQTWHPEIIAHRGGAAGYNLPENSYDAFAARAEAPLPSRLRAGRRRIGDHHRPRTRSRVGSGPATLQRNFRTTPGL
jgi:hypothetical protein